MFGASPSSTETSTRSQQGWARCRFALDAAANVGELRLDRILAWRALLEGYGANLAAHVLALNSQQLAGLIPILPAQGARMTKPKPGERERGYERVVIDVIPMKCVQESSKLRSRQGLGLLFEFAIIAR